MIIDTCKTIENMINNCVIKKWVNITIDDSKAKGKLFHSMELNIDEKGKHLTQRLADVCREIGWFNGEGLWIKIEEDRICLS